MNNFGCVFYRGPSLFTGDPIVGILTGLEHPSSNPKTGPMVQMWVLLRDVAPMDGKRQNVDEAVCGDCKLRGREGFDSGCYVVPWQAPLKIWQRFTAGGYHEGTWADVEAFVEGRSLRLTGYGDLGALPFEVVTRVLRSASGWTAYTHAWRRCDPRYKAVAMASVDTEDEFHAAHLGGWRTFRIRRPGKDLLSVGKDLLSVGKDLLSIGNRSVLEFVCPASDEGQHTTTCQVCQLCRGTRSPARSVAIFPHGKASSLRAFGVPVSYFGRRPDIEGQA